MTQCLIVDSCPSERQNLEYLLSPYGFDLAASTDLDHALEYCRSKAPDVVLLADRPGGPDAVGFIRRLRKIARERRPIVLLYADEADAENIGRAIWAGAADCLVRPFNAEVLDAKLRMSGLL